MTTNERRMSDGCPGGAYGINETWHEQLLPNGVQRPREKHEEEVSSEAILKRNPRKKSSVSSASDIASSWLNTLEIASARTENPCERFHPEAMETRSEMQKMQHEF